ncbi:MAG: uroporphyrinogen-III synthase [Firmicutes bacterium]|nr:uroporphyrinogen-III synthase [Bacillota bacterium]
MAGGDERRRPLAGRRVAAVGLGDDRRLARLLEERGAEPVWLPLLRVELAPPGAAEELARALAALEQGDWLALTSARAVEALGRLQPAAGAASGGGRPAGPTLRELRVAAVGEATARAAAEAGLRVALAGTEGDLALAEALARRGARRVLLPRSEAAGDAFPERLRQLGVEALPVTVYRNRLDRGALPQAAELLRLRRPEAALLTSSSTARALAEAARLAGVEAPPAGAIGESTRRAAEAEGLRVAFVAPRPALAELVEALEAFLAGRGP